MFGFLLDLIAKLKFIEANKIKRMKNKIQEKRRDIREKSKENIDKVSKLKGKELRALISAYVLNVLAFIVGFFEMLPLLLTLIFWFIVIIAVIVLVMIIFSIFSSLSGFFVSDDGVFNEIAYSDYVNGAAWSLEELASRGALLTDYEKNLYRLIMLCKETTSGIYPSLEFTGDSNLDATFLVGISSVETGMRFFKDPNDNRDILKFPSDYNENDLGYGMFGLNASKTLSSYFSDDVVGMLKAKYTPETTPLTDARYAPWGVAMAGKHLVNDMNSTIKTSEVNSKLDKIMSDYGIVENKDKLKKVGYWVLAQAEFHGASEDEYDAYLSFVCAMWAASSDVDANRSLNNWSLVGGSGEYGEPAFRHVYVGSKGAQDIENNGSFSNISYDTSRDTRLSLNGSVIDKPLWGYLHDKYKDNSTFMIAETKMLDFASLVTNSDSSGKGLRVLNFHYGINSFLQGNRVMSDVAGKLIPIETGDGDAIGGSVGDYEVTPGTGQGVWDGVSAKSKIDDYLKSYPGYKSYFNKLMKHFGKARYTEDGTNIAGVVWKMGKYGVPFYAQISTENGKYGEDFGQMLWHPEASSTNTYNSSGCMIYAHAYAASAMTGKIINPAEMGAMMIVKGSLTDVGCIGDKMSSVYSSLGLNSEMTSNLRCSSDNHVMGEVFDAVWNPIWAKVNYILEKGGVIVVRAHYAPYASGSNHYFVVTDKAVDSSGNVTYGIYTSSSRSQTNARHTEQNFKDNLHREITLVWK